MHRLTLALTFLLLQSQPTAPAESRPAVVELKPFGDAEVAQPRIAAVPTFGERYKRSITGVPPLHIVGQRGRDVVCVTSFDHGGSFTKPNVVMKVSGGAAARRGPRIAYYNNFVIVTAPQGGDVNERGILCSYSHDAGKAWSEPALVTDTPGVAAEAFHDLTVTTRGVFIVTWLDLRDSKKGQAIYVSRSFDNGKTWTKNSKIYSSPDGTVCECCPISIAAGPGNRVGIVFRNKLNKSRDLYYLKSESGGEAFFDPIPLPGKTWEINACPMAEGGISFPEDFDDTKERHQWPIFINSRDGEIFVSYMDYVSNTPIQMLSLGAGRRPTVWCTDLTVETNYISFVKDNGRRLALFRYSGDGPLREFVLPEAAEGEWVDSPVIGSSKIIYELRTKDSVKTRMIQIPSDGWTKYRPK